VSLHEGLEGDEGHEEKLRKIFFMSFNFFMPFM